MFSWTLQKNQLQIKEQWWWSWSMEFVVLGLIPDVTQKVFFCYHFRDTLLEGLSIVPIQLAKLVHTYNSFKYEMLQKYNL